MNSSIGLEVATKNRKEGHGGFAKISDFAIRWALFRLAFMSMSLSWAFEADHPLMPLLLLFSTG